MFVDIERPVTTLKRKVIQIAAAGVENTQGTQCNAFLFALCDDGTIWVTDNTDMGHKKEHRPGWSECGPIPQTPIGELTNDDRQTD